MVHLAVPDADDDLAAGAVRCLLVAAAPTDVPWHQRLPRDTAMTCLWWMAAAAGAADAACCMLHAACCKAGAAPVLVTAEGWLAGMRP